MGTNENELNKWGDCRGAVINEGVQLTIGLNFVLQSAQLDSKGREREGGVHSSGSEYCLCTVVVGETTMKVCP